MVRGILKKYKDISCPQSIREYYERLYSFKSKEIQRNMITRDCHNIESIPFKKYAEEFEVIDSRTVSIVVPRDEMSRELVKSLPYTGAAVARKLQMYTCSVYINELNDLIQQHVAEDYDTGIYCLTNLDYYSKEIGLLFEATDYYED